jgi:hypothetical protein
MKKIEVKPIITALAIIIFQSILYTLSKQKAPLFRRSFLALIYQELAPCLCRLPGFIGPVPPPLWIRNVLF